MAEKQELTARQHREDVEREVHGNPVVRELLEKHGAQICEIKIFKENP